MTVLVEKLGTRVRNVIRCVFQNDLIRSFPAFTYKKAYNQLNKIRRMSAKEPFRSAGVVQA